MNRILDVTTSILATAARLAYGERTGKLGPRPERPLILYDYEACPFCRKVREALTVLDLEAEIYPCPRGGPRFRPWVAEHGGKAQFPYLVDPNTGTEMYESDDINRYLFATYGPGRVPIMLSVPLLPAVGSFVASSARLGRGGRYRPATATGQPLELYSYEGSPFCRIVREVLCELEIPYLLHNVAQRSPSREAFIERSGKMQVPYLVDPSTDTAMFESADIVAYLEAQYATA